MAGEQPAIVDRDLFEAVQAKLTEQVTNHEASRTRSEALLLGRIYDDRGHRMTPSHVRKRGIKYRYYLSSALLQGRPKQAGTVSRVPAKQVEDLIAKAVRTHLKEPAEIADAVLIHKHVVRAEVRPDQLVIELAGTKAANSKRKQNHRNVITVPWRKTPSTRRREVLVPETGRPQDARPIRSENRALLIASIAQGRRWLNEIMTDPTVNTESIADREGCSARKVNMTISLAFLAPDLVKAAIEGRLPHGMGVTRLRDLPAEWPRQRQMLGLLASAIAFGLSTPQDRSAAGKRDSGPRDSPPEIAALARNGLRGDRNASRKSPPIAGHLPVSGKSHGSKECVVADAVAVEPVSKK